MSTNTERLLDDLPTLGTFLGRETGIDSYHLMTSSCSLVSQGFEKRAPTGIHDAFSQMMVLHHVGDLKVFNRNVMIPFSIGFCRFEMDVSPLACQS